MSRRKNRQIPNFRAPVLVHQVRVGRPQISGDLFPVRVAVGWLAPHFDEFYLAGSNRPAPSKELRDQSRQLLLLGRRLRDQLPPVDLSEAVSDLPFEYAIYVSRLLGDPTVQLKLRQGFELRLIDLHKVCVLQTLISLNRVASMLATIDLSDPLSTARLALPMTFAPRLILPSLSVQAQSLQVASVLTPWPAQPISHMHVAKLYGKYLLTDGHHRGYAFLKAGVRYVPGFYKVATSYASLGLPVGLLPASTLNKNRPPLLTDFLIDGVAVDLT